MSAPFLRFASSLYAGIITDSFILSEPTPILYPRSGFQLRCIILLMSGSLIDLRITQNWLEKSSDSALEEFKSVLVDILNASPEDRHVEKRWFISKISQGNEAQLTYDELAVATLKIENGALHFKSIGDELPRYDDILYAVRFASDQLLLAVYSNIHGGARLPQSYSLSLDHTYFQRDKSLAAFFAQSEFIPRYAPEVLEKLDDGRSVLSIYSPFYAENKKDGSVHILNNYMLDFLSEKEDQRVSSEFSYRVADSMDDFARKYDVGLIPGNFYQSSAYTIKVINDTYFDVFSIDRKVFIDPYVWDFDAQHDYRFYKNVKNGAHYMDKVRSGEDLDTALKRFLREELQVANDYVGARIWGIEFDRDRDGILTPRLKMNVFVRGVLEKHRNQTHDWVSLK